MGFTTKNLKVAGKATPQPMSIKKTKIDLDKNEIGLILNGIKNANFQGKDVQSLFNLVLRLQDSYSKL
tara:strand:- start:2417 stop:2620 length:204 start_codon:yes stop_codon:yes gene_type:complete